MTGPWDRAATARPLPWPVTPMADETLTSHIRRLAQANRWNADDLNHYIRFGADTAPALAARLAAISGTKPGSLRYAVLELCTGGDLAAMTVAGRPRPGGRQRTGCRRCTRGATARFWTRHEDELICLRHRLLLGDTQRDLTALPEILTANRRHRRLIRRWGREPVRRAFTAATGIVAGWEDLRHYGQARARLQILEPLWQIARDDPARTAAVYPETVALTRLLAAPHWRSMILDGHRPHRPGTDTRQASGEDNWPELQVGDYLMATDSPAIDAFLAEIEHATGYRIDWTPIPTRRNNAPLAQWVIDELDERHGLTRPTLGQPPQAPETFD